MPVTQKETLGFQTEVKQLLHLMIHALYSNKEIFLRELISNAADAADKLRFAAITQPELYEGDAALKVRISFDQEAKTLTIADNGIGMTREEVIANLGTIAKSGTREFLASLSGDQAKDAKLIGQFGVGFYSAFIVADKVTVLTRRAGSPADQGVRWESAAQGDFSVETIEKITHGTEVILHLKDEETEFLDNFRLRHIVTKYSDHINLPVVMKKTDLAKAQDETPAQDAETEETINRATALWTLSKNEIKEEEYNEFYKHIAHDFENPLIWSHNRVEGKQEYTSLLYVPARAPFDLWEGERRHGLKLYVRRVFIMDEAEQFLPLYLRFIKGVLDSNDLPLNISREILQSNRLVDSMRTALTKRVLGMLEKLAQDDKEKYSKFWNNFGQVLKEGPAQDTDNKETIAKLLRFASTQQDTAEQNVSLEDYISRMQAGQEKIYYITGESFNAVKNSPHLEIFRKKGIEVLLMSDRIDEWMMNHLTDFSGKSFQSIAKGDLDLGKLEDSADKEEQKKAEDEFQSLLKQVKDILGEKVKEVRVTHRLTTSPACLVLSEQDYGLQMQRLFKASGQTLPASKPIFELNPQHPLVLRLKAEQDDARFAEWVHILFDQAVLAEGAPLEDSAQFVQRLNKLLLELST